jgi:hypothetical protein
VGRLALALALIAAGAAMFAASARTDGSVKDGGIFRVGFSGASVQVDPQLAYVTTAWWLEYATAAKLVNWPDRANPAGTPLVLEAASSVAVSNRGKTYTFVIRKGLRFSDGSPVTARSFAYAIDRTANKQLASPGAPFITDSHGTNILGAKKVNDGHARHVSGVTAKGYHLVIRLTRPDGSFLSKLTFPFFQATSTKLPLNREVLTAYPSAGPYTFTKHVPDSETELRRNRFYRGPRPRHLIGVDVRWNLNEQSGFEQVLNNQLDEGPLPAADVADVATRFGVNKTRFWTKTSELHRLAPLQQHARLVQGQRPDAKGRQLGPQSQGLHRRGGPARGLSVDASAAAGLTGLDRNEEAPALLARPRSRKSEEVGQGPLQGRKDHRCLLEPRHDHSGSGSNCARRPDQARLQAGEHQLDAVLLRARAVPGQRQQVGYRSGRRLVY